MPAVASLTYTQTLGALQSMLGAPVEVLMLDPETCRPFAAISGTLVAGVDGVDWDDEGAVFFAVDGGDSGVRLSETDFLDAGWVDDATLAIRTGPIGLTVTALA